MLAREHAFSRLLSLDVFRGMTVLVMILVNSPGNRSAFAVLEHSAWNGCTLADLVFPFFIFIVGVSSVLTLAKQQARGVALHVITRKIILRAGLLFAMGVLLNALSLHMTWSTLRIFGVLQRIALCYAFSAWLYLTTRLRTQVILIVLVLIAYWFAMTFIPIPGYGTPQLTMHANLAAYLDRLCLAPGHLYAPTFDPEGLCSTVPAIATVLLGNLMGAWLLSRHTSCEKLTGMLFAGVLLAVGGWFWGYVFPINKTLWTSSYVLWTAGLATLTFTACYWLIEIKYYTKWSWPFELVGMSALMAYVLHVVCLKIQAMVLIPITNDTTVNLRLFITQTLFPWSEPRIASLLYALSYTLWCFCMVWLLSRKNQRSNNERLTRQGPPVSI